LLFPFFQIRIKKKKPNGVEISAPTGPMIHKIHVDLNYNWEGEDPSKVFTFGRKLGEGAYGAVHQATQTETGFTLAIKILKLQGDDNEQVKK